MKHSQFTTILAIAVQPYRVYFEHCSFPTCTFLLQQCGLSSSSMDLFISAILPVSQLSWLKARSTSQHPLPSQEGQKLCNEGHGEEEGDKERKGKRKEERGGERTRRKWEREKQGGRRERGAAFVS